jgi:hypothetical protein
MSWRGTVHAELERITRTSLARGTPTAPILLLHAPRTMGNLVLTFKYKTTDYQLTAPPPDLGDSPAPGHPDTTPVGTGRVDNDVVTYDTVTNDTTARSRTLSHFVPAWLDTYGHTSSSDDDDENDIPALVESLPEVSRNARLVATRMQNQSDIAHDLAFLRNAVAAQMHAQTQMPELGWDDDEDGMPELDYTSGQLLNWSPFAAPSGIPHPSAWIYTPPIDVSMAYSVEAGPRHITLHHVDDVIHFTVPKG